MLKRIVRKIVKKTKILSGIKKISDTKWRKIYLNKNYENMFFDILNSFNVIAENKMVLISGFVNYYEKETFFRLLNSFLKQSENTSMVALDQLGSKGRYLFSTNIPRIILPKLGKNTVNSEDAHLLANEKEYVNTAAECLAVELNCEIEEALCSVAKFYDYYIKAIDKLNPSVVLVWNQFLPSHIILVNICKERGIIVLFAENGVVPGTWVLEENGQMGASDVSVYYDDFINKKLDEKDFFQVDKVLNYLKLSGANRYYQENQDMDERIQECIDKNIPTILFAGNYDAHAGIVPYNEDAKKYHSPFFKNSNEAVSALAEVAEKNNWKVIYKPHPRAIEKGFVPKFPDSVIYIEQGNLNDIIDSVNVIATLTSQTSYISCIREKATLLLGRNQLTGKKAVYEINSIDEMETVLSNAIKKGMTEEQKFMFKKHIAQILKYYVFDDNKPRRIRYGRSKEEFVEMMNNIMSNL